MIDRLLPALTFLAALSCGLAAGVFYAFSSLVMRALARLPSSAGIAAMQSINVSVINPLGSWFVVGDVLAFLGERKDRVLRKVTIVPVITPLLYGMSAAIAPLMVVALWPPVTAKPTRSGARRGTDSRLIRGVNPLCWMSRSDQVVRH